MYQHDRHHEARHPGGLFFGSEDHESANAPDWRPPKTGPTTMTEDKAMQTETTVVAAGTALLKFLPAALGAAIMVMVDPPKSKRELFMRAFVALAMSFLFGEFIFDLLDSTRAFSFLDANKRHHVNAVDGFVGAVGWFVAGGLAVMLQRWRARPFNFIDYFFERFITLLRAKRGDGS